MRLNNDGTLVLADTRDVLRISGGGAGGPSSLLSGLTAAWELGEASGSRADSTANALTLTDSNGVTQSSGVGGVGNAAQFVAASSQSLTHVSSALLQTPGACEFHVWFYLDSHTSIRAIFSKDDLGGNRDYWIEVGTDGIPYFYFWTSAGANSVTASVAVSNGAWHAVDAYYDPEAGQIGIAVDNGAFVKQDLTGTPVNSTAVFRVGHRDTLYFDGRIAWLRFWNGRNLTPAERTALYNAGAGTAYPFAGTASSSFALTAPQAYQVSQRSGTTGGIVIHGVIADAVNHDIEARFNGGAWSTIVTGAHGNFNATLGSQAQGQGTLDVRAKDKIALTQSIAYVGIGEVFVIAGQSNAVGQGTNLQVYSHATLKAGLFGNDYLWHELYDPSDDPTNQVDTISQDSTYHGSAWLPLATSALAALGIPVAFVPCALDGSSVTAWQPGGDHQNRATLYGSMVVRALRVGGVRCVLWWQGEIDALNAMPRATYLTNLTALADAVFADIGCKVIPCKFQNTTIDPTNQTAIINAIGDGWAAGNHILTGPDLSDLVADDGLHLQTDLKIGTAATRWWNAIKAAFGW